MKKVYIFNLITMLLFLVFSSFNTYALETNIVLKDTISDSSPVADDLKIINVDINNYKIVSFKTTNIYIIGYAEAYSSSTNVDTYLYLYTPNIIEFSQATDLEIYYYLYNNSYDDGKIITPSIEDYNTDYGIVKLKGCNYSINPIDNIKIENFTIANYPTANSEQLEACNNLSTTVAHSYSDSAISITTSGFNGVIVIDDLNLFTIQLGYDQGLNFTTYLEYVSNGFTAEVKDLHFYNFNIPDNISYDSINSATFKYDEVLYRQMVYIDGTETDYSEIKRNSIIQKYNPGTQTLGNQYTTANLDYSTFYLGNRVSAGEFGSGVDLSAYTNEFNYDCSILLGITSSYVGIAWDNGLGHYGTKTTYEKVNMIEIELNYKGSTYSYLTESVPVDEDKEQGANEPDNKPWYETIFEYILKFFDFLKNNLPIEAYYGVLAIGGLFILGIVLGFAKPIVSALLFVFKIIALPFKAIFHMFDKK